MVDFFQDKILSGEQRSSNISPVYRVLVAGRIRGDVGQELQVIAQTPEEIGLQIDNEWESWIANGEVPGTNLLQSRVLSRLATGIGVLGTASGITRSVQGLTSQIWRGTTPLEIQLPLLLNARENAFTDVVVPIRNLIQLASPYRIGVGEGETIFNNLIHAPGPTLFDVTSNNPNTAIRLEIGRIISIPSVVITSIQADIPNRYTAQGHPIEANLNVSLRTHYTYLREDYNQIFGGRDQQVASARPDPSLRRPAVNRGRGFSASRSSGRIIA